MKLLINISNKLIRNIIAIGLHYNENNKYLNILTKI